MKAITKQKGDIGETAFCLECLKRGWEILWPNGDRKPYDLVIDVGNKFLRIQIKTAWLDEKTKMFYAKRVKTLANRKNVKITPYKVEDFDFAVCYILELNEFYIIPSKNFVEDVTGNQIGLKRVIESQRECFGTKYLNNWTLIENLIV